MVTVGMEEFNVREVGQSRKREIAVEGGTPCHKWHSEREYRKIADHDSHHKKLKDQVEV